MMNRDNDLAVKPNHHTGSKSEKDYQVSSELKSEKSTTSTIFSEATTRAVALMNAPVAILSTSTESGCQINSVIGLEKLNRSADSTKLRRELGGLEYCHGSTIDSSGVFIVNNFQEYPQLVNSSIYRLHQIQAYLGVTITTAAGDRLGAISILDFVPREFSDRDVNILQLIARLVASECERSFLSQSQLNRWMGDLRDREMSGLQERVISTSPGEPIRLNGHYVPKLNLTPPPYLANNQIPQDSATRYPLESQESTCTQVKSEIQFKLLTHLTQELRTPLTSILGMARVLQQEIYGELSVKQKEYLNIIHHSGLQLVQIVDEVTQLGAFEPQQNQLTLRSSDLELLCQLSLQSLEPLAAQKQQRIVIDLMSGDSPIGLLRDRRWLLDKDKVRQIIYYLSSSLIQCSANHHQITIQMCKSVDRLQIQITTSDPQAMLTRRDSSGELSLQADSPAVLTNSQLLQTEIGQDLRTKLGLSMSQTLAAVHGATIQFTPNGGGYQLNLPLIFAEKG